MNIHNNVCGIDNILQNIPIFILNVGNILQNTTIP